MDFVVGKRYKWSPYSSGKKKWKNGVLRKIIVGIDGARYGIFVTRDDEEWHIPLWSIGLEEYKKS